MIIKRFLKDFIPPIVFKVKANFSKKFKFEAPPVGKDDFFYMNYANNIRKSVPRGSKIGFKYLIESVPLKSGMKVLDIGMGKGDASIHFLNNNCFVEATGIKPKNFKLTRELESSLNISECFADNLPYDDNIFDVVWMSHVLEHCINPNLALLEILRVLKNDGLLCIMVPPYSPEIKGGHVSTGWNLGQLMYYLLLSGFDIKKGSFIKYGYNICGFVRPRKYPLPKLQYDVGDLEALNNYWPDEYKIYQGVTGDVYKVNWPLE